MEMLFGILFLLSCPPGSGEKVPFSAAAFLGGTCVGCTTRLHLVNPHDHAVSLQLSGLADDGQLLGTAVLPAEIPPRAKWSNTPQDLFGEASRLSWAWLQASDPLMVYVELRSDLVCSAFKAPGILESRLILPHVAKDAQLFQTTLYLANGTDQPATAKLRSWPGGSSKDLPGLATPWSALQLDMETLLGSDLANTDWAEITAGSASLAGCEAFASPRPGASRDARLHLEAGTATLLRFLHVASDLGQFWTGVVYMDQSGVENKVVETYFNASGAQLEKRDVTLSARQKRTLLFDHTTQASLPAGTVWLEVRGAGKLSGYELFGSSNQTQNDFSAGLQAAMSRTTRLDFAHFDPGPDRWNGIVLVNLGTASANLEFLAFDAQGTQVERSLVEDVAPMVKLTRLMDQLFSSTTLQQIAWVRVQPSGSYWAGFQLWGDLGTSSRLHMAGLEGFSLGLPASPYAGRWEGTSDQNLPVSFTVTEQGEIVDLAARIKLSFPTFSCTITYPQSGEYAVEGDHFDVYLLLGALTNLSTWLHGRFTSPASASGNWDEHKPSGWFVICGNSFSFGSGGATLPAKNWIASKKP